MKMSNLPSKLEALNLELGEDWLMHLVLISLPTSFGQFKVSYNTHKDKQFHDELISHCVQKEERLQKDKFESVHLSLASQNKKRKKTKGALSKKNKRKMKNLLATSTRSWDT